ncbi:TPA: hypothetical protein ACF7YZ_000190 [Streptococcus agalactiae]|uniref:hypothetical protein n=1 Tax=Streptococcus dysgalactiae TaxID=1334 RepID=UPI0001F8C687|nr:hypothetical protein [Streptococcus dysgalactiae]ADX24170.1 hypothetical protein SDE12394_03235 [Streptococcus dysgalactiae subsp. equisimilis ATCC 12394]MCY7207595.1 hypothetical protein [Streptococcus dysgalactiae]MCY7219919.1 hypothetical protein [Streptococcus dysgalactiae]MCY7228011.1 hypothetical protein [Streptococcus dysgalactiae]OBZ06948.1 hypothetical protein BBG05_03040 [Streptococcus dysgalactiae subsp. equisimilis]
MIGRTYLPFQSAREHQDRGMLKWMGFFLSEHTTSLNDDKTKEDVSSELTLINKLKLISQLYAGQLAGLFTIKVNNRRRFKIGTITEISPKEITIKTTDGYQLLQVADILNINLWEGDLFDKERRL